MTEEEWLRAVRGADSARAAPQQIEQLIAASQEELALLASQQAPEGERTHAHRR